MLEVRFRRFGSKVAHVHCTTDIYTSLESCNFSVQEDKTCFHSLDLKVTAFECANCTLAPPAPKP